jgi:3-phenylpropionate/cinnamic acid dioxygenase small subunit
VSPGIELIDFVYDEARMLDEGRYDEWLALWLQGRPLLDAARLQADRSASTSPR